MLTRTAMLKNLLPGFTPKRGAFVFHLLFATVGLTQPGRISLVAGGVPLGEGRPGPEAQFYGVGAIALDPLGGLLVIEGNRLVRIDPAGIMKTIAGSSAAVYTGHSGDGGPAISATFAGFNVFLDFFFSARGAVTVDAQNAIYITDPGSNRIRKIDPDGVIRTIAGNGFAGVGGDGGPAVSAQLQRPGGLVRAKDGTIFVAQPQNHRIRKIDPQGTITTFVGDGVPPSSDGSGGSLDAKRVNAPQHLALDSKGNLYVSTGNVVLRISPEGTISIFAGTGRPGFSGDNGPALNATLNTPRALALDSDGNLYIEDNTRIRVVQTDGIIRTIAGNGRFVDILAANEPVPALESSLSSFGGLAVSANNRVFVSENWGVQRVRVIDPSGTISPVAGADRFSGIGGPAAFARIDVSGVFNDNIGNLYIYNAQVIRKVDPSGKISHFAGNPGGRSVGTTPIPAIQASLGLAVSVRADAQGGILVLDRGGRIMRIDADGLMSLVAGIHDRGFDGDGGPALKAKFNIASDMAVDSIGVIYIADQLNNRIRRIALDGTISTIAGTGAAVSSGDNGPAITASLWNPVGLAFDRNGDLLVGEINHRLRRISKTDGRITKVIGDGTCSANDLVEDRICDPRRIDVGPAGEIYVAQGSRIARLSPNGAKQILTATGWRAKSPNDGPQAIGAGVLSVSPTGDLIFGGDNKVWKAQGNGPFVATPTGLSFAFALGAPSARQAITLETGDGNPKPYQIRSNAPWLSVNLPNGTLELTKPVNLLVTADPKGLPKGSYTAKLTVRNPEDPAPKLEIIVSMTISGTPQQMRLSQTGFAFSAVQNGAVTSPRSLQVLNTGIGSMPWTATVQTLTGGNWLQVTPASGTSEAGRATPEIRITTVPAGLVPGVYFGLVTVAAAGVDNAPQSATVLLNVTTANQPPGALIEPAGLLFTANVDEPAAPQQAQFANLTGGELTYSLSFAYPKDTPAWALLGTNAESRLPAGATARLDVKANTVGLKAGVYTADLLITVGTERTPRTVSLVLVVASGTVGPKGARNADGCVAKRLVPVFLSPVALSQAPTGWPTSVSVRIVDDCAQPLTDGRVTVSFSTGDPAIALVSEGGGRWSGTWAARTVNARVTLNALARSLSPALEGTGKLDVGVRADNTRPLIAPGGVRSAASQLEGRPVPMSSPIVILGSQLVPGPSTAAVSPLPTELNGTSALIASRPVRLRSVTDSRLEGVLPSGIPDSTPLQMIVKRGNTYSVPEPVIVTLAEPAIYSVSGTGVGQGMVYAVEEDGKRKLADSERPLKPGDQVAILCTGLGPVDKPVADGQPAPADAPPQALNPVTVTIQNQLAEKVTANLAPGLIGIYWVTATVPKDLVPDATADIIVKIGDLASPPVTAAILPPAKPSVEP